MVTGQDRRAGDELEDVELGDGRRAGKQIVRWIGLIAAGSMAVIVAVDLVRPFSVGPVGFDSAASVIYFDRIAAGRSLEAFITATPKPLLTIVYGSLHALSDDWRSISWATIGAYGVGIAMAGWLVTRVAGIAAGGFVVAALLAARVLLADVAIAYAVPWAMVGWMVAGLALTATPRRHALAGVALALAGLARLETLVVVPVAALAITCGWILWRAGRLAQPPDRRWWLVPAIGLLAIPVMLLHDWLLTGDPLFWTSVSARYSEAAPESVMTPLELVTRLFRRYLGTELFSLLALAGGVWLLIRRAWVPLVGLVALGPGIAAFLVVLAIRGTYVSPRYFAAIDIAVLLAAAAGAGALARWGRGRWRASLAGHRSAVDRWWGPATIMAAVVLAAVASWPIPSLDPAFRTAAGAPRQQAERDAIVVPVLDCALDALPGARDFSPPASSFPPPRDPAAVVVLVAGLERPRLAVDLAVPLDKIGGTPAAAAEPGSGFLPNGRLAFHDRRADPDEAFASLEVSEPTTYGTTTLVPLLADDGEGVWVLRIDRLDGASGGPACNDPTRP